MTKADIINKIAESTGLQKKDVSVVVESFMENIKNSLLTKKENVYLRGFGSFIVKHRAAKTARNILKKTTIKIGAHDQPSFKPAKCFICQGRRYRLRLHGPRHRARRQGHLQPDADPDAEPRL